VPDTIGGCTFALLLRVFPALFCGLLRVKGALDLP